MSFKTWSLAQDAVDESVAGDKSKKGPAITQPAKEPDKAPTIVHLRPRQE